MGFTRDRLGSTGKKATGAILIILDSRTRLNFIKFHCTLFFSPENLAWLFILKEIEPSPDRKMATDIR